MANPNTGRGQLNSNLLSGASELLGPASQIAQGAHPATVLKDSMKDAALDRLLGPAAMFGGILVGALRTMKALVDSSGILERGMNRIANNQQIQGRFEAILKSVDLAKQRMKELSEFTIKSPFKFEDVAEGNRLLQTLTRGAYVGAKSMELIGDTAAAAGQDFSVVAEQVGKLYSAIKSGRPIEKLLQNMEMSGVVTQDLVYRIENLMRAGASATEVMGALTASLEQNRGGMADQNKTIAGMTARLEEAQKQMAAAFGQPFVEAQTKSMEKMVAATQNLTPLMAEIGHDVSPLFTLFESTKSSIESNVLASKSFAGALSGVWKIVSAISVAMAGATVASFLKNVGPVASGMYRGAKATQGYRNAAIASANEPGGRYARATQVFGQAKESLANGAVGEAAAYAGEAGMHRIAGYVSTIHSAALSRFNDVLKEEGAQATISAGKTYALAVASSTLKDAWSVGSKVVISTVKGMSMAFAELFLFNPVTAAAAALAALAYGAFQAHETAKQLRAEYKDLRDEIAATNAKLREQTENIRTTDDWAKSVDDLSLALAKAREELDALIAKKAEHSRDHGFGGDLADFFRNAVGVSPADFQQVIDASMVDAKSAQVGQLMKERSRVAAFTTSNLAMGTKETEDYAKRLDEAKSIGQTAFQGQMELADSNAQIQLLDERIAKLKEIAAIGAKIRDDEMRAGASASGQAAMSKSLEIEDHKRYRAAFEKDGDKVNAEAEAREISKLQDELAQIRRNSGSELVRVSQQVDDEMNRLKVENAKNPDGPGADPSHLLELNRRKEALIKQRDDSGANAQEALQTSIDAISRRSAYQVASVAFAGDQAIESARGRGAPTALLEAQKENAVFAERRKQISVKQAELTKELASAKDADGSPLRIALKANEDEAAKLAQEMTASENRRANFRQNAGLERAKNQYLTRNGARWSQGLEDAAAVAALRDQYQANGLDPKQAQKDWALQLQAQAASSQNRITSDSLQAVGGGGGFSDASPVLAVQRRIADMTKESAELLKIIASNTGATGGIKP